MTVTRFVCGSTHTEVFVASGRLPFVTGVPLSGRQSLVAADLSVVVDHGKRDNIGRLGHEGLRLVVSSELS